MEGEAGGRQMPAADGASPVGSWRVLASSDTSERTETEEGDAQATDRNARQRARARVHQGEEAS